jgi:hypothetical protein
MPESQPRSERIASAIKRLSASADTLLGASDQFAKPIEQINQLLRRMNLGLITWKRVAGGKDEFLNYWSRDVGFAKIKGEWCLAIRTVSGNDSWDNDDTESWAYVDAPPSYRIEALDVVPDLIEELVKNADKTAAKLKESAATAKELADAAVAAANEARQQKKASK